jgi:two-component system, chemotaxis family, CheB/CheR fusion protein
MSVAFLEHQVPTGDNIDAMWFSLALSAANIGVWHWQPNTGLLACSYCMKSLCGLADDIPTTFETLLAGVHPDDRPKLADAMMHAAADGAQLKSECRFIDSRTQSQRWLLIEGCRYVDDNASTVHVAGTVSDISSSKQVDAQRELLLHEMRHRMRNVFAIMGAIVSLSERTVRTSGQLADALRARIGALDRIYGLLPTSGAAAALPLRQIIEMELAVFADLAATRICGPPVDLGNSQAVAMHLIAHELTTNALKHGALSQPGGRLDVLWFFERDSLVLHWNETGTRRRTAAPARTGFGSRLLALCARMNLGGEITYDYEVDGVRITLVVPVKRLGAV